MQVNVGDRIVTRGRREHDPDKWCTVTELCGEDGSPPYRVRWGGDGHQSLYFPGSDARVEADPGA